MTRPSDSFEILNPGTIGGVVERSATPEKPIKGWTRGVEVEADARKQLKNIAGLPFIHRHVAVMPDVHLGHGATVGSVIATKGAVVPAAVGVDIGCGMMAVRTDLTASDLPDNLARVRSEIEAMVPHGRTNDGKPGDRGAWGDIPSDVEREFMKSGEVNERGEHTSGSLYGRLCALVQKHPKMERAANNAPHHLGTLGTGNHFIELCLDEAQRVWVMLHSGSRGIGNNIGSHFINKAKEEMQRYFITLPDADLAYLVEGSQHLDDYIEAVGWAQDFAMANRQIMMARVIEAVEESLGRPLFEIVQGADGQAYLEKRFAVNCHHNYIARERHWGDDVFVTRKGAVYAGEGVLGIIPGSMGAKSFIVRGRGEPESFCSCSHGAGRRMSRTEAKRRFTLEDHAAATKGIECRKDADVVDETPAAYKSIDAVMAAQADLVDVVHTLKQVVCVKG